MSKSKASEFSNELEQWANKELATQNLEEEIREKKNELDKVDVERRFNEHRKNLSLRDAVEGFDLSQVKASPEMIVESAKDRERAIDFIFP